VEPVCFLGRFDVEVGEAVGQELVGPAYGVEAAQPCLHAHCTSSTTTFSRIT
jgi:hypothetical protein